MLFRRRLPDTFLQRLRLWSWPRRNWQRSGRYHLKRLRRLPGTPYALAMGTAIGAAVSTTPLVGLHVLISIGLGALLRANLVAAAIGTAIGNPLTFPLFWAASFEIGQFLLPGADPQAPPGLDRTMVSGSLERMLPLLGPMLLGSIPIGIAVGCPTYLLVYRMVATYQSARRIRLEEKRRAAALRPIGEEPASDPGWMA